MRDIQTDGTPTATAAPASTPRTRRRGMGTGGDHKEGSGAEGIRRYMACAGQVGTCGGFDIFATRTEFSVSLKCSIFNGLRAMHLLGAVYPSLTFRVFGGLTPALLGKTFFSTRR